MHTLVSRDDALSHVSPDLLSVVLNQVQRAHPSWLAQQQARRSSQGEGSSPESLFWY
jgi:hypothetical protein